MKMEQLRNQCRCRLHTYHTHPRRKSYIVEALDDIGKATTLVTTILKLRRVLETIAQRESSSQVSKD